MQNKKISHLEVMTNQISGVIIGWLVVYFIFPWFGVTITATQTTISSIIFFISSYSRMYLIRRFFNYHFHRVENE